MNKLREAAFILIMPVILFLFLGIAIWVWVTFDSIDIISYSLSFLILSSISCFILSFLLKRKDPKSEETK